MVKSTERIMNKSLGTIKSLVPRSWLGKVQYRLTPSKLDGFGVFNDQCFRQIIFFDLNYACRFEAFVETGTFVGCTTAFMARNVSAPVYTAEIDPRNFEFAKRRLGGIPNVHIVRADSTDFLASLPLAPTTRTFFYLDAHLLDYLPLADEAELMELINTEFR